jgi:hypothetical protein
MGDFCSGTPDVLSWLPETKELYVGDLKTGQRPVAAEQNVQLMLYAYGYIKEFNLSPSLVLLQVLQPPLENFSVYTPSIFELTDLAAQVKFSLLNAHLTNPGGRCGKCEKSSTCSAFKGWAFASENDTKLSLLDIKERKQALSYIEVEMEAEIRRQLEEGVLNVDGWELGSSRKTKHWKKDKLEVLNESFYTKELISPAMAIKLKLIDLNSDLFESKSTKPSLIFKGI